MPSPEVASNIWLVAFLLLCLAVFCLSISVRRLRTRLTAAERESRRLSTDLDEYLGRLRRAELQGDGLAHRLTTLRNELVADDDETERARADLIRKLSEPPRF